MNESTNLCTVHVDWWEVSHNVGVENEIIVTWLWGLRDMGPFFQELVHQDSGPESSFPCDRAPQNFHVRERIPHQDGAGTTEYGRGL